MLRIQLSIERIEPPTLPHTPQDFTQEESSTQNSIIEKIKEKEKLKNRTKKSENLIISTRNEKKNFYTTIVGLVFVLIFTVIVFVSFIMLCVVCCRISSFRANEDAFLREFFIRAGRAVSRTDGYRTLSKEILERHLPKRKLGKNLGKYNDNT